MKAIDHILEPRKRDLGGFTVGRVLPSAQRRMIGPFIFLDEMGPADFPPGAGIDVRPHPHIGLATVTYLFDGELRHRDSLGYDQVIRPGDVNWMTAGRGIVHSERTDDDKRASGQKMHGIQSWVALPDDACEIEPSFHHHPKETLPLIEKDGLFMRLIAGSAFGETSPVKTFSPIFYLGAEANEGVQIPLPADYEDRAIYLIEGGLRVNDETLGPGKMIVFASNAEPIIETTAKSRLLLLGGAPLGDRLIWWNFVAKTGTRMEEAKRDWVNSSNAQFKNSVFALPPGETEFIPLPEN